jgi:hypothetical protein
LDIAISWSPSQGSQVEKKGGEHARKEKKMSLFFLGVLVSVVSVSSFRIRLRLPEIPRIHAINVSKPLSPLRVNASETLFSNLSSNPHSNATIGARDPDPPPPAWTVNDVVIGYLMIM